MTSKPQSARSRKSASGFTLIEVLIAVFVLAVGLLGVAGMQMIGLRNNNSAAMRTQAVFLAQDIADRMRANPTAVAAGGYDDDQGLPSCPDSSCTPSGGCSPDQMANYDRCAWLDAVAQLPGGQGQLTLVNAAANVFQARIMWDDQKTGATGTACGDDLRVDLLCFDLQFRP